MLICGQKNEMPKMAKTCYVDAKNLELFHIGVFTQAFYDDQQKKKIGAAIIQSYVLAIYMQISSHLSTRTSLVSLWHIKKWKEKCICAQ